MACRGSSQETCSTKSPEPCAAASATIRWARSWRPSGSRPTARGGKPREMILTRGVCWRTSLRPESSWTSLCGDTTQNPPSTNPPTPLGWSFHQIGAVRRNSASSSTGSRSAWTSGSVKSNPGGRLGTCLAVGSTVGMARSSMTKWSSRPCARKPLAHHGWEALTQYRRPGTATCSSCPAPRCAVIGKTALWPVARWICFAAGHRWQRAGDTDAKGGSMVRELFPTAAITAGAIGMAPCAAADPHYDGDVPGMNYQASLGAPCDNYERFIFGRGVSGQAEACHFPPPNQFPAATIGYWVISYPLYGIQQTGAKGPASRAT